MRFKGTVTLFTALLVVGGYVYFTEFYHKEERQKQEQSKNAAIHTSASDITELSLIYPDRTITAVKKGEKQWEITAPAGVSADSEAWEALTAGVSGLTRDETVTPNAEDLSQYGLSQPSVKVSAKFKDGKSTGFAFGSENPKKTGLYTKILDSNEVFLTAPPSARTFTKTLSDLRNKKLLEFEAEDIDGVKIVDKAKEIQLQKSADSWQLTKPVNTNAEDAEVISLVTSIHLGRALSFPDSSVDAKTAGLNPPNITISLHDRKTRMDHVLLIGTSADSGKYYAKDVSRDLVFFVDGALPLKAALPMFNWRDKSIAKADWQRVDKIEIQRGSENLVLLKAGPDWKLADGTKVRSGKVSQTLDLFESEKVRQIIDTPNPLPAYGLDKPRLEAVFRQGANEIARVAFGMDSKTPAGVYLKDSRRAPVMVLSKEAFDKLNLKPDQLTGDDEPSPAAIPTLPRPTPPPAEVPPPPTH